MNARKLLLGTKAQILVKILSLVLVLGKAFEIDPLIYCHIFTFLLSVYNVRYFEIGKLYIGLSYIMDMI